MSFRKALKAELRSSEAPNTLPLDAGLHGLGVYVDRLRLPILILVVSVAMGGSVLLIGGWQTLAVFGVAATGITIIYGIVTESAVIRKITDATASVSLVGLAAIASVVSAVVRFLLGG